MRMDRNWQCSGVRLRACGPVLALAVAAAAGLAAAQSQTQPGDRPLALRVTRVDVSAFPEVTAEIIVRGTDRALAGCLGEEQFQAEEDGSSVPIRVTQSPAAELGAVILLIDRSSSMAGAALARARSLAQNLAARLPTNYLLGVTTCGGTRKWQLAPSSDRSGLPGVLDDIVAAGRDGLVQGAGRALAMMPQGPSQRAIVLLSDGRGMTEREVRRALKDLKAADVVLHAVAVSARARDEHLRSLAEGSGGMLLSAPTPDDLTGLCQAAAPTASGRYLLTYTSRPAELPRWSDLEIGVHHLGAAAAQKVRYFSLATSEEPAPAAPDWRPAMALGALCLAFLVANLAVLAARRPR